MNYFSYYFSGCFQKIPGHMNLLGFVVVVVVNHLSFVLFCFTFYAVNCM